MITLPLNSKLLQAIAYDEDRREIHATFWSGKKYVYSGVQFGDWKALTDSPSVGSHFLKHIKPVFACTQVKAEENHGAASDRIRRSQGGDAHA